VRSLSVSLSLSLRVFVCWNADPPNSLLLFKTQKSVLPKIERARDAIRTHNDFEWNNGSGNSNNNRNAGYGGIEKSVEAQSIDFRVKSSLCATTANALDACAKELVKCANANTKRVGFSGRGESNEGRHRVDSASPSRSNEVMQLRCVFLGRSGVGKSHVVNSLLRRACVPKRGKVEKDENDDDDDDDDSDENEDEDEKMSGYETAREEEEEEEDDELPPILQSPGKKKGFEDDIDAMVLDVAQDVIGTSSVPLNDSDEEAPSFMVDRQDDLENYMRYERFKVHKIEYEAARNVETLEESVRKAKEQASIELRCGNTENEEELDTIERERRRQIEIEKEERRKKSEETKKYAAKIPVCEDEEEIEKKMTPKEVGEEHEKHDFLLCEGDIGDTTSVSCAATLGDCFKLEIRYHSSRFVYERVRRLRQILEMKKKIKKKDEWEKKYDTYFYDRKLSEEEEENRRHEAAYYDACIDYSTGSLNAEAASACAMTGHEPYAANLNDVELENVTIPKILIDRLGASVTFVPHRTLETSKQTMAYFEASVKMLRTTLREETTHGCWGCVRDCTITLPCVNPIYRGLTFVDAPGAGEADPARMQQLRKELSNADVVFIVADARRLPEDVRKALKKSEFLRKFTEDPERFKIVSVMQGDRCFDGLDTVWRKAVNKIEGLNKIAFGSDDSSGGRSSGTAMDCESQEGKITNEDDEDTVMFDDDKEKYDYRVMIKDALKRSLPTILEAPAQSEFEEDTEEKKRLQARPPTGLAAKAAISEVHRDNAEIVANERFYELLDEITQTRGSPPEMSEFAKALKATFDRSKRRDGGDDDLQTAMELGARFRPPEGRAALHQSWTFVPLSISWVQTLREELMDETFEEVEGSNARSYNDKIDAFVDEICGFARIDRALLEFLPKNAVKRAAFTLDLAAKVLDYFVKKASPIAYIHDCPDSEARALQIAVNECFGEDAEDVAAQCGTEASRVASLVAIKACDEIVSVFQKYVHAEPSFELECVFDYFVEKLQDLPLRKTKDYGDLYESDKKTLSKTSRDAARAILCQSQKISEWSKKAAKSAVELWLRRWNYPNDEECGEGEVRSASVASFRDQASAAALRELFQVARTADYGGGENDDDLTGWVQTERMINMTPEEIVEEKERQREAGMNTPLETIVRSKVREAIVKVSVISTNENRRDTQTRSPSSLDAQKFFQLPKNFFPVTVANGSISLELEKQLRESFLDAANHLLNVYDELFMSYVDETFSAMSEEDDYADTLRMSLSEKYAEIITMIASEAMITVRSHAERFFMRTFISPVRKHVEVKIANLMKPLTANLEVAYFRERCVKKQWIKRAKKDANLAQVARRACSEFTKAALSSSNDDDSSSSGFDASASRETLKDKKLRQIEHQLMCSKLPPFYEDPRAFVSIAECITRPRKSSGALDVIDYGLETRAALDAIATGKKKREKESTSIISVATIAEEDNEDNGDGSDDINTLTIENRLGKLDLHQRIREQKGREARESLESQETILRHRNAADAAGGRQHSDEVTPDQSEPPLNKIGTATRSSEDDTSIQGTTILNGSSELDGEEEEEEEEGSKKKPKLIKDETLAETYERCFKESLPPKSGRTR